MSTFMLHVSLETCQLSVTYLLTLQLTKSFHIVEIQCICSETAAQPERESKALPKTEGTVISIMLYTEPVKSLCPIV